jgi:pSer/pThr/pTyr-binding forkhead associated (FHA) protein
MREVSIGRARRADIRLVDPSVSRLHAQLLLDPDGRILLIDTRSRNGTFVWHEGAWSRVTRAQVASNGRVRFGNVERSVQDLLEASAPVVRPQPSRTDDRRPARLSRRGTVFVEAKDKPAFDRPKRNPISGDIEEGG